MRLKLKKKVFVKISFIMSPNQTAENNDSQDLFKINQIQVTPNYLKIVLYFYNSLSIHFFHNKKKWSYLRHYPY